MNPKDGFTNRTSIRNIKHLPNPIPTRNPCSTHSAFTIQFGDIISILQNESTVTALVPSSKIFAIQRKQGTDLPAVVVDLIDIKTNETKHRSSDLVTAYADNPRESYTLADTCRRELDNYVAIIHGADYEIRFDDLETGITQSDETFVTVAEYRVTVTRPSLGPHV